MPKTQTAELYPYSERGSTNVQSAVETLTLAPEQQLSSEELREFTNFGHMLMYCPTDKKAGKKTVYLDLAAIDKMPVANQTQEYDLDFLRSEAGKTAHDELGITENTETNEDIKKVLFTNAFEKRVPTVARRDDIARDSVKWRTEHLQEALALEPSNDARYIDSEVVSVNAAPEKLLQKVQSLQGFRHYYAGININLAMSPEPRSPLRTAELTLLRVQRQKVNATLALLYPHVQNALRQFEGTPLDGQDERGVLQQKLATVYESAPIMKHLPSDASNFMRRLDLIRNGAALSTDNHEFSPVSVEARQLADDIEHSAPAREVEVPFVLRGEVVSLMDKVVWRAGEVQTFTRAMLEEWGLLSEHTATWDEVKARTGPAADGKWQVVMTSAQTQLETMGRKKVIAVPEKFERSLTQVSPAGALPVITHELTHAQQDENDRVLAGQVPLAEIHGPRFLLTKEMGGIYEERVIQAMFGRTRPTNTTYLRALETKLAGGNQVQVARAFMAAGKQDVMDAKKRKSAAESVQRLYRHNGFNSQPLDYLEQDLLVESLEHLSTDRVRTITLASGSFALSDVAELHRVGVLTLPTSVERRPAEEVLGLYVRRFVTPEIKQLLDAAEERK